MKAASSKFIYTGRRSNYCSSMLGVSVLFASELKPVQVPKQKLVIAHPA